MVDTTGALARYRQIGLHGDVAAVWLAMTVSLFLQAASGRPIITL